MSFLVQKYLFRLYISRYLLRAGDDFILCLIYVHLNSYSYFSPVLLMSLCKVSPQTSICSSLHRKRLFSSEHYSFNSAECWLLSAHHHQNDHLARLYRAHRARWVKGRGTSKLSTACKPLFCMVVIKRGVGGRDTLCQRRVVFCGRGASLTNEGANRLASLWYGVTSPPGPFRKPEASSRKLIRVECWWWERAIIEGLSPPPFVWIRAARLRALQTNPVRLAY